MVNQSGHPGDPELFALISSQLSCVCESDEVINPERLQLSPMKAVSVRMVSAQRLSQDEDQRDDAEGKTLQQEE